MSKGNIIIVEDEFIISDDLSATLEECGYKVVGVAENVDEFLAILTKENSVDLVLLDINLNQPVDGVQIAHIINTSHFIPFIFVTAFTDAATIERVKHTKPHGYVSKPYNEIDLMISIDLALNRFKSEQNKNASTKALLVSPTEYIFIKTKKGLEKINVDEIRWIEAYDYYSFIRLKDEKVLATVTLKELEQKIKHPAFVKVHRKYSINFNHVEKIIGNEIEISGELIPVSRSHKESLLNRINSR